MPPKGSQRAPASRRAPSRQSSHTATGLRITTVQKVLIVVAILAGFGAIAAGFASLPSAHRANAYLKTSQYKTLQTLPIKPIAKKRLTPGMVLKAPQGTTLYYYAVDKKRYVFPSIIIFNSWFGTDKAITTIPADQLAGIPIQGSVRIRPGSHPIKLNVDPKIYTTSKGGELHWITKEDLVVQMYGPKWASKTWNMPDYQFVQYSVGDLIKKNAEALMYGPAQMFKDVKSIDQDLGLVK